MRMIFWLGGWGKALNAVVNTINICKHEMLTDLQKKNLETLCLKIPRSNRADDGNRTRDLLTTNEVRYRLCHIST